MSGDRPSEPLNETLRLAKVEEHDDKFLREVFYSSRNDEYSMAGWDEQQLHAFLMMQFDFQIRSYNITFPDAENSIIWFGRKKAGRLLVDRKADAIRLVDISLLPEFRNLGIGSKIITNLKTEAHELKSPLRLRVATNNEGAFRFYRKLGFEIILTDQVHHSMEWRSAFRA